MKRNTLCLLFCTLICCIFLPGCSHEKDQEFSLNGELNQLPTPTTYTDEEAAIQTADFRDHVVACYQEIQSLAEDEASYERGRKLAQEFKEQYSEHIEELSTLDFTEMSRTKLDEYMLECTTLTTKLREIKDALTLD